MMMLLGRVASREIGLDLALILDKKQASFIFQTLQNLTKAVNMKG